MVNDHLSRQEEQALIERYRRTHDRAVETRLVRSQMGLVHHLARAHSVSATEREDLVQEGLFGLVKAIRRFEPARRVRLSTYAAWWIRAYQYVYIIKNHRLVRLGTTQTQRRLFFRIRRLRARLTAAGLEPTAERMSALLDATPGEVREMAERLDASELSLDAPAHGDNPEPVGARTAAMDAPADELAMARESERIVRQERDCYRAKLVGRRREVFDARWLVDDAPTLQALGQRYGLTRERMRQIERGMLDELRLQIAPRLALAG